MQIVLCFGKECWLAMLMLLNQEVAVEWELTPPLMINKSEWAVADWQLLMQASVEV